MAHDAPERFRTEWPQVFSLWPFVRSGALVVGFGSLLFYAGMLTAVQAEHTVEIQSLTSSVKQLAVADADIDRSLTALIGQLEGGKVIPQQQEGN